MRSRVVHDGKGILQLHFSFDPLLVAGVKAIPGRRWDGTEKYWAVPDAHVVAVVELLRPEGFGLCEVTRRLYRERGGTLDLDASPVAEPRGMRRPAGASGPTNERTETLRGASGDFTVSRLNTQVSAAIKAAFRGQIWLVGEVSGFNKAAHKDIVGFHLVERNRHGKVVAEVTTTLFSDSREEIESRLHDAGDPFRLEDEVPVRVRGRVELYVPWGLYRFVIEDLDVDYTLGEATRRRDEIRRRLVAEGILEQNRGLTIPVLPLRVGLVTSLGSDACNDVVQTFRKSGFAFRVVVHGARVQGQQAEPSILNALTWFRARASEFDVLMICRGGGSRTDLAWFDSLTLARAVATFPLPVVVGIGHEADVSVLDFVGWSHKTPTAAAEWVVRQVQTASDRLESHLQDILGRGQQLLKEASSNLARLGPGISEAASALLDFKSSELQRAGEQFLRGARRELTTASRRLEGMATNLGPRATRPLSMEAERIESRRRRLVLLEPRRVIERGYAIVRMSTGKVLTDPSRAPAGTVVVAELKDGSLRLRSEGSEKE